MSAEDGLVGLPRVETRRLALRVTPAAERAVRAGHPWLFEQSIQQQSGDGRPGDLAVVFDRKGRFLAVGLYDPLAPLRVRLLQSGTPASINHAWFSARLAEARRRRALFPSARTNGYRLVHGENDGLPGLVLDLYGATAVLKLDTAAWIPHLRDVLAAVTAVIPLERLVLRLSRRVQQNPEVLHGLENGRVLLGSPLEGPVRFLENGLTFEADVVQGQKTGFFLDQRDNRARVEALARGKTVLNVFAYTGGFSLYAARGGATQVVSLDISRPALAQAVRHFQLNRGDSHVAAATHEIWPGDAFRALPQLRASRRRFDMVVVDPPSFARRAAEVPRALAAYRRLTQSALGVLRPGGVLVAASCSSRVDAEIFFEVVQQAAAAEERPLRPIERTAHPLDHPIGFAEGAYLKCLFAAA